MEHFLGPQDQTADVHLLVLLGSCDSVWLLVRPSSTERDSSDTLDALLDRLLIRYASIYPYPQQIYPPHFPTTRLNCRSFNTNTTRVTIPQTQSPIPSYQSHPINNNISSCITIRFDSIPSNFARRPAQHRACNAAAIQTINIDSLRPFTLEFSLFHF